VTQLKDHQHVCGEGYELKSYPSLDQLQIHLSGRRIAEFKKALARALNTYENAPRWLWELDELLK
jgi:hypothetical protein